MPTEVVTPESESSEAETPEAEVETPATPPEESITTLRNRLAGKDRAYTALKAERDRLTSEVAGLSTWKAEKEQADMTEVERLQKEIADLRAAKATAEATATRAILERKYPLTFDHLGEKAPLDDEGWLAELEGRLVALKGESESEARIDANNPRKPSSARAEPKTADELEAYLRTIPNPFARE